MRHCIEDGEVRLRASAVWRSQVRAVVALPYSPAARYKLLIKLYCRLFSCEMNDGANNEQRT